MGDTLGISIKVDAGGTLPTLDKVEAGLEKVEHAAEKASLASFNSLKTLASASQHQADMLARIHGPMNALENDMRSLENLQRKGLVTAKQYADELARIGKSAGLSRGNPMDAVSLPGMPESKKGFLDGLTDGAGSAAASELAGQLTAVAGPAALAAASVSAIGDAIGQWAARSHDMREATNEILKFHDSIDGATAAMGEQEQLSKDLHMNITRNLTAALVNDGGSIENVAGIMGKLQYAQEAGTLSSRELKGIWQQSDDVADMFAKSLGMNYEQLQKMAKAGKITGVEIEKMIVGMSNGSDGMNKFGMRLRSVKEEMEATNTSVFESMITMQDKYVEIGETTPQFIERIVLAHQHQLDVLGKLEEKVKTIFTMSTVAGGFAATENMLKNAVKASSIIDGLKTPWEKYTEQIKDTTKALEKAGMTHEEVAKQISKIHPPDWVDYYKQQLDAITQPEKDWAGRQAALDQLLHNNTISVNQYNEALGKARATYISSWAPGKWLGNQAGAAELEDFRATSAQREGWREAGNFGSLSGNDSFKKIDDVKGWAEEWKKSLDEIAKKTHTVADAFAGALTQGATSFGDALVDAANGADVSFTKVFSDIGVSIEKAILNAMILRAVGSFGSPTAAGSGLLGLFGGANGFDAMVPGGRGPFLPGFAHGGDMMVGGSGGTDSKLFQAMVTPGETVSIMPNPFPNSRNDKGQVGQGGHVVNNVTNNSNVVYMFTMRESSNLGDRQVRRHLMEGAARERAAVS